MLGVSAPTLASGKLFNLAIPFPLKLVLINEDRAMRLCRLFRAGNPVKCAPACNL